MTKAVDLGRKATKQTNKKLVRASAPFDQCLSFTLEETLDTWLSIEHQSKTLIRLCRCAGWSEFSMCAPSDQCLSFTPEEMLDTWIFTEHQSKTLIRLRRCAGRSEFSMCAHANCTFFSGDLLKICDVESLLIHTGFKISTGKVLIYVPRPLYHV